MNRIFISTSKIPSPGDINNREKEPAREIKAASPDLTLSEIIARLLLAQYA
jgi:hypothetical protein